MTWKLANSGRKKYTIQQTSSGFVVRKNDGFTWSSGTKLGTVSSLANAISAIKSDSGSSRVDIHDK